MQFEFYVPNYNFNLKKVEMFNVFRNIYVQEYTEKAIKKYLRNPSKYSIKARKTDETLYGFEALCEEIKAIIMWQEWSRCEYEIGITYPFLVEIRDFKLSLDDYTTLEYLKEAITDAESNNPRVEKWDCYKMCEPNIEIIARECIYQYKQQRKENKND